MKTYNITVAYTSDFEIEAENEDEAKDTACRLFFEEPERSELLEVEVEDVA